jgi:hypothetical protein
MKEGEGMHQASVSFQRIKGRGRSEEAAASCRKLSKSDGLGKRGGAALSCHELAAIGRDEGRGGDASCCNEVPDTGINRKVDVGCRELL